MIETRAGETFEAVLEGAPTGLTGTVAVRVVATPGGVIVARSAAGITEPAPGVYVAERTVPAGTTDPSLLVVWDLGDPADPAGTFTEELRLSTLIAGPVTVGADGGVVLDANAVRLSTARLMAFRLRQSGFAVGQGGLETTDFTPQTTPTLAAAIEVTERNAALVSDDFPGADASDEPELRTIAALRSAIELEASVPNMDRDRITTWREQLRESVGRVADGGSGAGEPGPGEEGYRVLRAVWDFGGSTVARVPGAEVAVTATGEPLYDGGESTGGTRPRRLRW